MGEICGGIEMTQENIVENWKNAKPGTLKLDWQEAEEAIGFKDRKSTRLNSSHL